MKTRKRLSYAAWIGGLLLLSFLLFSVYIYSSVTAGLPAGPPLQMSRIDFQTELDSTTANRIRQVVQQMEGVRHAYCNIPAGILVYSHDPRVQPAGQVFARVTEQFSLPARRFVVDAQMAASSCPVTGDHSIFMQVGGFLTGLFSARP